MLVYEVDTHNIHTHTVYDNSLHVHIFNTTSILTQIQYTSKWFTHFCTHCFISLIYKKEQQSKARLLLKLSIEPFKRKKIMCNC